jgi:hypothetical protein
MSSSGVWRCVDLALTEVSEERIASIFRVEEYASHLLTLAPRSRILLPWRWRRYVPPKCRLTQDLHSATPQKTIFFIVTAVKASNLTSQVIFTIQIFIVKQSGKTQYSKVQLLNCNCQCFFHYSEVINMYVIYVFEPQTEDWRSLPTVSSLPGCPPEIFLVDKQPVSQNCLYHV